MQPTSLSRSTSHATGGRTLKEGDNNSAYGSWDGISSSIIQTPDQKQWIDLELLNPRFLKGLSQYAQSDKEEPNSKLGKGAAKIKAWARQSKAGIDIRLRRKINNEKDEITDIRLVPDAYPSNLAGNAEKSSLAQELPAMRSIAELADTGAANATELDANDRRDQPSRSSTGSTLGEPLPRYEREPGASTFNLMGPPATSPTVSGMGEPNEAIVQPADIRHRPSVSQSSIVATPTRGLSMRDTAASVHTGDAKGDPDQYATVLEADLQDANKKLGQQRQLAESLQAIIQAISEEQPHQQMPFKSSSESNSSKPMKRPEFDRLKIAKRTTYETETEHEPTSPPPTNSRRKIPELARRKKRRTSTKANPVADPMPENKLSSDSSDVEPDAAAGSLIRKQTLPKRVPASAGIEALWRSLIHMQTILLGPDHRLTVQAKSGLRSSKAANSMERSTDLAALQQSRITAERDFGLSHPWVAAFTEDLERLASLTRQQSQPGNQSPTVIQAGDPGTLSRATATEDLGVNTSNTLRTSQVTVTGENSVSSLPVERSLHKIDTSVQDHSSEKESSPVVGGVEIDAQLDMLWNTGRLPHQPQNTHVAFVRLGFAALSRVVWGGIEWLQKNYGPEQPVEMGKTRVRWTCYCGERLHDDFIEKRPGAARALEAYLNRPKGATLAPVPSRQAQNRSPNNASSPTTAGSSPGRQSFGSSFGAAPSSQTSFSNNSFPPGGSWPNGDDSKMQQTWSSVPSQMPFSPTYEPP